MGKTIASSSAELIQKQEVHVRGILVVCTLINTAMTDKD